MSIIKTSFTTNHDYFLNPKVKVIDLCSSARMPRLQVIRSLRRIFLTEKPDVVVSFIDTGSFYTSIALAGLKIIHVCSERNNPAFYPHNKLIRFMRLFAFQRCQAIVFQTEGARDFFGKKIRNKGVIIGNPIENNTIQRVDFSQINNTIVAFGRLEKQKNYTMLIDAFFLFAAQNPLFELHIYGRGKMQKELEMKIDSLGLSEVVKLCGFADNVPNILSKSKIFALSSLHEGLPNALLEALSSGIPSISTDCPPGGPKQLLNGCRGSLLVENDSSLAFAEAIKTINSKYSSFYSDALEDSKHIKDRYDIDKISNEWIQLFKKLAV